jgi:four helix bundle protein
MPGTFEDLEVYRKAREFRKRIWRLTRRLPDEERFVLVPQMRRASLSVTNNIAEGHGSWGWRHNVSYLRRSRGSVNELLDDLNACEDESYFKKEHLDDLRSNATEVLRLINGYIRYLRKQGEGTEREDGEK